MAKNQVGDILRVQGVLSRGFGLSPKLVAKDKRLTIEAKGIYAYLASYAGSDFEKVFPSRSMILDDLGISVNRYYKHLKLLIDYNYITVEKTISEGNRFGRNIYTIIMVPDASQGTEAVEEKPDNNIRAKKPARIIKRLSGSSASQGIDKNEKLSEEPVAQMEKEGHQEEPVRKWAEKKPEIQKDGRSAGKRFGSLSDQLQIEDLINKKPENQALIKDILMVIEDMATSEQVTINGSIKKKAAIRDLIGRLRMTHIEIMVNNITSSGQKIINKKGYIQSCIGNVIFDVTEPLDFSRKKKPEENNETAQEIKKRTEYALNPALEALDKQITGIMINLSKALLSGNELQHKALLVEKNRLEEKREKMVLNMNVTS